MLALCNVTNIFSRERPAAIPIEIKSIDDTSNFDEFPDSDILTPTGTPTPHFQSTPPMSCASAVKCLKTCLRPLLLQPPRCPTTPRQTWRTRTGSSSTTPTNASKAWRPGERYRPTWSPGRDERLQSGFYATAPWNLNESSKPLLSEELQPWTENAACSLLPDWWGFLSRGNN